MAELNSDLAPQVFDACVANAEEVAGAIGRAFDGEFVAKPTEPAIYETDSLAEALSGAGMAFLFRFGEQSAVAMLPASSGILPDWCKSPDATGESKLSTLGQELSMLLMPDDLMADDFKAIWLEDLSAALAAVEPAGGAMCLPLELVQGETLAMLQMIWPVDKPEGLEATSEESSAEAEEATAPTSVESAPVEPAEEVVAEAPGYFDQIPTDLDELPPTTLSLLQVQLDVSVNLASKKQAIEEIVELGPGSIITFDKSCNDLLEVAIGDIPIALGEAIKVGEKFGVRVHRMTMPDEHFKKLLPPKVG